MIRLIPILLTALLLTTWTTNSNAQLEKSGNEYYKLSIGLDVARPLVGLAFGQYEFGGYFHWHIAKRIGLSINTYIERIEMSRLEVNVTGTSRNTFSSLGIDLKIIERFWVSGYVVRSRVSDRYHMTLSTPNFNPGFEVSRLQYHSFSTLGFASRMTYFEVLTDRIEMQVFIDAALMGDLNSDIMVSKSTPGFLIGVNRVFYMGAGINIGYRMFEKKPLLKK
ncbi:MAG: hypothetical protein JXQ87_15690 [Bacteroidia bacterium]